MSISFSEADQQIRAIVFDADGTLTPSDGNAWLDLTYGIVKIWGTDEQAEEAVRQHKQIYSKYRNSERTEQDHAEMVRDLKALWTNNGQEPITKGTIKGIVNGFEKRPELGELRDIIQDLKQIGMHFAIISASFNLFVEMLADYLGIEYKYANSTLRFVGTGDDAVLTAFDHRGDFEDVKLDDIETFIKQLSSYSITAKNIMAFGDNGSDEKLFEMVNEEGGVTFAVESTNEKLLKHSTHKAESFRDVIQALKSLRELLRNRENV